MQSRVPAETHERPQVARRLPASIGESLFLLPALALVVVLMLIPGVYALVESFFAWNPGYASPYSGLTNYRELFATPAFQAIIRNYVVLLLGLPLWTLLPLVVALALQERVRWPGLFRSIILFPAVLSPAILGILWRSLLQPDGLVNTTLDRFGLSGLAQPWIDSPTLVKPALIFILLWAGMGIGVVIYSAGLAALPTELMEAAELDGAGWWSRLRYIVVPHLRPMIAFYAVYNVIGIFLFSFGYIYVITSGGPGYSSTTFDYDIYENALRFGYYGIAAAESVVLLVIVVGISALALGAVKLAERRST
jgi:ABC-type sugar transport system permease subunit